MVRSVLFGWCVLAPVVAVAQTCPPEAEEFVQVAAIVDADTLRLDDGRVVRLVSILVPKPDAGDDTARTYRLSQAARKTLDGAAVGRRAGLAFTGTRRDRHGRLLAHVLVDGSPRQWLQALLIEKGLARAYALEDNYQCVRHLLEREAAARNRGSGLWSTGLGAFGRADRPDELGRESGRFMIVEGTVITVGDRPRRTYLNFGTNWSEDFTVFVDRGDVARFEHAGFDLTGLAGRRVRVRGWIREDRGPALKMTVPEQLEIVGGR